MKNTSLLFKWIWRLGSRNYAYWKKIIVDKYTLQFTNGIPTLKKKLSPIWSDIVSTTNSSNPTADALRNSCHMRLDNDFNIRFQEDTWIGSMLISFVFPKLYRISNFKHGRVVDMGCQDVDIWRWKFIWSRPLRKRESEQHNELLCILHNTIVSKSKDDQLVWALDIKGLFSVKGCSFLLDRILFPGGKQ